MKMGIDEKSGATTGRFSNRSKRAETLNRARASHGESDSTEIEHRQMYKIRLYPLVLATVLSICLLPRMT